MGFKNFVLYLGVNYKGGTGFLMPLQHDEVFCHL